MNFTIHWYIDGSHQIHEDCWGQTGSLVFFGAGAVSSSSNKQKSNTKSSTETEIIALHDKLSDVIWMRYFVECQGYTIDECIIFQDIMSASSLEKNGQMSSSKRTKHIKAKYFLIKDYYDAGEVDLRYCPTGEMWADVLAKPLQGQLFRDMRAFLQNCSRDYDDDLERQEDERVHHMIKQQVATVTSSRECVDEQSQRGLNSGALVGALVTPAKNKKVRRRSNSPKCVSWTFPSEVSGKKTCSDTQESIRSENMDRRRALVPLH
jgi:hypothetical protein